MPSPCRFKSWWPMTLTFQLSLLLWIASIAACISASELSRFRKDATNCISYNVAAIGLSTGLALSPIVCYESLSNLIVGSKTQREINMKNFIAISLMFLLLLLAHAPLRAQTKRIASAYSAISGTQTAFYLAADT